MYTLETKVRYSECSESGQAGLADVFNYMQDACTFQAEELGVGVSYMQTHQWAWILNSLQADIRRYPKFGEKIKISTWPYDFHGFYGYRNFKIEDEAGSLLVCANSVWVFLDLKRGRPAKIDEQAASAYTLHKPLDMQYEGRRIPSFEPQGFLDPVRVPRYFMDTNHHMNHAKYILLAQECLAPEFQIAGIHAQYCKSAVRGDLLYPCIQCSSHKATVRLDSQDGKTYAVIEFYAAE